MKNLVLVAVGGGLGASLRYLTGIAALRWFGPNFPWGTLVVNVIGSFLMGMIAEFIIRRVGVGTDLRLFLMTGLLGGYTTFSAFSLDAILLFERGALSAATGYILLNVIGAILALMLGLALARNIF
ncbi:fluoride efflux transporter CrcB [Lentilitoribacter sp. EG35]|uniref:fluoride efflux transporter CrcB n=1 Tax=Lentilitoribacter sp. Alg239-R112 TaxID=2305987 RepID=UPI0013A6B880|nr:fluoride efflux transporter CrcB [Lentilitoribacter sp. Alg239-R112]